jgi:hypothetical protein
MIQAAVRINSGDAVTGYAVVGGECSANQDFSIRQFYHSAGLFIGAGAMSKAQVAGIEVEITCAGLGNKPMHEHEAETEGN